MPGTCVEKGWDQAACSKAIGRWLEHPMFGCDMSPVGVEPPPPLLLPMWRHTCQQAPCLCTAAFLAMRQQASCLCAAAFRASAPEHGLPG
eukprot:207339-Chlamydomonas_euryale.AAC.2